MRTTSAPAPPPTAPPPIWELDAQILALTADQQGINLRDITPRTRLIKDLHVDSLDLVDYVSRIEREFDIFTRPSEVKHYFTDAEFTLHDVAVMVFHRWGSGKDPARKGRKHESAAAPSPPLSSQLFPIGAPAGDSLLASLGSPGRFPLFQRATDGMRCALMSPDVAALGSDDPSATPDELPAHTAPLSPYLIDAEPVSTTAFARFLNAVGDIPEAIYFDWCDVTDHRVPCFQLERVADKWRPVSGTEQHPMVLVSWYGANAYSLWANRRDWRRYRGSGDVADPLRSHTAPDTAPPSDTLWSLLPSEAQWEHAARAGGQGAASPWAGRHVPGKIYTAATMEMLAVNAGGSSHGLAHLPGNVWQWCRDYYSPAFYSRPDSRGPDPQGVTPADVRSERGGSWVGPASLATATYRRARAPHARGRCLGFRCVTPVSEIS